MESNQLNHCVHPIGGLLVGIETTGSYITWDAHVCGKPERRFSRHVEMQFGATWVPRRHRRKGIKCRGLGLECSIWISDNYRSPCHVFRPFKSAISHLPATVHYVCHEGSLN